MHCVIKSIVIDTQYMTFVYKSNLLEYTQIYTHNYTLYDM